MKTYPLYADFTKPRVGHDLLLHKETCLFDGKFKVLDATIIFNPSIEKIEVGDIIYFKLPSEKVGMFRILSLLNDKELEEVFYGDVVFCGYQVNSKPGYFTGFKESWNKVFPSKVPEKPKIPKQTDGKVVDTVIFLVMALCVIGLCGIVFMLAAR